MIFPPEYFRKWQTLEQPKRVMQAEREEILSNTNEQEGRARVQRDCGECWSVVVPS